MAERGRKMLGKNDSNNGTPLSISDFMEVWGGVSRSLRDNPGALGDLYPAERLTEWRNYSDDFFCYRAFIANLDLMRSVPALAGDLIAHEKAEAETAHSVRDRGLTALPGLCVAMLLSSARKGGRGKDILINAYKAFYPSEYGQLKRFTEIGYCDIISLANDDPHGKEVDLAAASRFATLSEVMGIARDSSFPLVYSLLYDHTPGFRNPLGSVEAGISCRPCGDDVLSLMRIVDSEKTGAAHDEALEFVTQALARYSYPEFYAEEMFGLLDEEYDYPGLVSDAAMLLHGMDPRKPRSYTEFGMSAVILHLVRVITHLSDSLYGGFVRLTGTSADDGLAGTRYSAPPEKDPRREPVPAPAVRQPDPPVKEDTAQLMEEMAELKRRLRASQESEKALHAEIKSLRSEMERHGAIAAALDAQTAELNALREYVYNMEEEDDGRAENGPDEAEMAEFLRARKVVIIGGNPNWTKKIKQMFPKWEMVPASANGSASVSFANADMVYFFTDTMSHMLFEPFIRRMRETRTRFSYIHGVNIGNNIRQIYRDLHGRDGR